MDPAAGPDWEIGSFGGACGATSAEVARAVLAATMSGMLAVVGSYTGEIMGLRVGVAPGVFSGGRRVRRRVRRKVGESAEGAHPKMFITRCLLPAAAPLTGKKGEAGSLALSPAFGYSSHT